LKSLPKGREVEKSGTHLQKPGGKGIGTRVKWRERTDKVSQKKKRRSVLEAKRVSARPPDERDIGMETPATVVTTGTQEERAEGVPAAGENLVGRSSGRGPEGENDGGRLSGPEEKGGHRSHFC